MGQKIKCRECNDVIESTSRHDFKYCTCGNVFVDGGEDYLRFGWKISPPVSLEGLEII